MFNQTIAHIGTFPLNLITGGKMTLDFSFVKLCRLVRWFLCFCRRRSTGGPCIWVSPAGHCSIGWRRRAAEMHHWRHPNSWRYFTYISNILSCIFKHALLENNVTHLICVLCCSYLDERKHRNNWQSKLHCQSGGRTPYSARQISKSKWWWKILRNRC